MLSTSALLKSNSAISAEECVLLLKVFTTATRKLRVKNWHSSGYPARARQYKISAGTAAPVSIYRDLLREQV